MDTEGDLRFKTKRRGEEAQGEVVDGGVHEIRESHHGNSQPTMGGSEMLNLKVIRCNLRQCTLAAYNQPPYQMSDLFYPSVECEDSHNAAIIEFISMLFYTVDLKTNAPMAMVYQAKGLIIQKDDKAISHWLMWGDEIAKLHSIMAIVPLCQGEKFCGEHSKPVICTDVRGLTSAISWWLEEALKYNTITPNTSPSSPSPTTSITTPQ
ncbi:hypothetical protein BDN67DRAFT_984020 [Paxillus ammoniavirescens]|nr:hypothetical protein BDN67DRAFT_984020 [Paxillus ammoniavirescens]